MILGNHDHYIERNGIFEHEDNHPGLRDWFNLQSNIKVHDLFTWVGHYLEVQINKQTFVLCHYPISSWNGLNKGWIHLHGHIHSQKLGPGKTMDVGFDSNSKFSMYSLTDVMDIMNKQSIQSNLTEDHHERDF